MIFPYYGFILAGIAFAAVFQILFLKSRKPLLLVTSILWLLPVLYETWVLNNCTGECNIRVDVLVIFPIEVIVLPLLSFFAWRAYKRHTVRP